MNVSDAKKGLIAICVLVTLLGVGLSVQQYNAMRKVKAEWLAKEKQREELKAEIAQVEAVLAEIETEQEDFAKYLFEERDIPSFLDKISQFAKDSLVSIVDMQTKRFYEVIVPPEVVQQASGKKQTEADLAQLREMRKQNILTLAAMPIQIKVEGSFSALAEFLAKLQEYEQLINISSVEIETQREYPRLSCNFTLRIYSLKSLEELKG